MYPLYFTVPYINQAASIMRNKGESHHIHITMNGCGMVSCGDQSGVSSPLKKVLLCIALCILLCKLLSRYIYFVKAFLPIWLSIPWLSSTIFIVPSIHLVHNSSLNFFTSSAQYPVKIHILNVVFAFQCSCVA